MNVRSRDWPPDNPQPRSRPEPKPPKLRVLIMLLLIVGLFFGSPLAAWFVAELPGDHPWAPAVWPAGWGAMLVVFLIGSYLDIRSRRQQ